MASSAIYLMVLLYTLIVDTTKGFRIENVQSSNAGFQKFHSDSFSIEHSNFPVQPFSRQHQNVNEGPIAGYPKVPPPNAYESGGVDGDLLPPEGGSISDFRGRNQFFRRSTDFERVEVDPQSGKEILKITVSDSPVPSKTPQDDKTVSTENPLVAQLSWKNAGENGNTLKLPLEGAVEEKVDPKTGYPLQAQPHWKNAGGNEDILELPLEEALPQQNSEKEEEAVDPKTGYPLKAELHWKDAGGNEDILELPLEGPIPPQNSEKEEGAVDPKTGYPLKAELHWKDAGGNEDILELPLEDPIPPQNSEKEEGAVDPKTGYPLKAELHWKDAGGNEDILELPLEDPEHPLSPQNSEKEEGAVDPKTGYPLKAELHWKDAGGNEDILELPLEDPEHPLPPQISEKEEGAADPKPPQNSEKEEGAVDPKTGYPLKAELHWKDAGGNEDILELPLEDPEHPLPPQNSEKEEGAVDPKTGYPLKAELHWKDAGGNGDFLELPLENPQPSNTPQKEGVDPKTGYPFQAEPDWKNAGGNGDILELPMETSDNPTVKKKIDSKTGYPLDAEPSWKDAGGNGDILDLPFEESTEEKKIDKKTGYPFVADPSWRDAGGNEEIIELPLENTMSASSQKSETEDHQGSKTNFAFQKISTGGALNRRLGGDKKDARVDPKTGYPLVAQSEWSLAGGNGNILQVPFKDFGTQIKAKSGDVEDEDFLAQLRPPALESNYYTGFGGFPFSSVPSVFTQTLANGDIQFFDTNRIPRQRPNTANSANNRQQRVYTLSYPDNAVLTVSSFSSGNNQNEQKERTEFSSINQKQHTHTFSGDRTLNNDRNSFKSFPTTRTTVHQQFKISQPSGITNFQQHQIRQSPSFLVSNIATNFT